MIVLGLVGYYHTPNRAAIAGEPAKVKIHLTILRVKFLAIASQHVTFDSQPPFIEASACWSTALCEHPSSCSAVSEAERSTRSLIPTAVHAIPMQGFASEHEDIKTIENVDHDLIKSFPQFSSRKLSCIQHQKWQLSTMNNLTVSD